MKIVSFKLISSKSTFVTGLISMKHILSRSHTRVGRQVQAPVLWKHHLSKMIWKSFNPKRSPAKFATYHSPRWRNWWTIQVLTTFAFTVRLTWALRRRLSLIWRWLTGGFVAQNVPSISWASSPKPNFKRTWRNLTAIPYKSIITTFFRVDLQLLLIT